MAKDLMSTKEVADYLGVHEKQIYALIKAKKIPCTRVTGKWVFPRNLIDKWINSNAKESLPAFPEKPRSGNGPLLAAGSNDPVLDILLNFMKQKLSGFHIFSKARIPHVFISQSSTVIFSSLFQSFILAQYNIVNASRNLLHKGSAGKSKNSQLLLME